MTIQAPVIGVKSLFHEKIDADSLIKIYKMINENIFGKVAITLHTGEKHGSNFATLTL